MAQKYWPAKAQNPGAAIFAASGAANFSLQRLYCASIRGVLPPHTRIWGDHKDDEYTCWPHRPVYRCAPDAFRGFGYLRRDL